MKLCVGAVVTWGGKMFVRCPNFQLWNINPHVNLPIISNIYQPFPEGFPSNQFLASTRSQEGPFRVGLGMGKLEVWMDVELKLFQGGYSLIYHSHPESRCFFSLRYCTILNHILVVGTCNLGAWIEMAIDMCFVFLVGKVHPFWIPLKLRFIGIFLYFSVLLGVTIHGKQWPLRPVHQERSQGVCVPWPEDAAALLGAVNRYGSYSPYMP